MPQPNIVFVLTDDQGYGDLGCAGNPIIQTPNIDKFHGQSVRFANFHVGPTCAPTRAGLMTGHYCNSTGVWHTIGGRSLLREEEWTLANALRGGGYRTGMFGKWHLGDSPPFRPHERGFDVSVCHGGGGISQTPDWWGNDYFDDTYHVNGEPRRFKGYCTDVFFDEAMKFIEDNRERPFFCYIATNAPHGPLNVEKKYSEPYLDKTNPDRARFYGMITNIDENFGRLRDKLRELGIEDNTILIFMTDNGTATGCALDGKGFVTDGYNMGMRGKKGSEYDGGHRVPFFLRHPTGGLDGGRDILNLTANIDVMPTLLDLCGVDVPEGRSFHGKSLAPLLRGEAWEERTLTTDSQRLAYPVKWRKSAVMTERWRLVNGQELYDITTDPEQRRDIATDHPGVVEALRAEYEKWWELCSAQFDRETPIHVGGGAGEAALCCHDWRNDDCNIPYMQGHVREGMEANGVWHIDVREAGEYVVDLYRWPREAGHAVTAGIDGDDIEWRRDVIAEQYHRFYTGGKALDIQRAILEIGGKRHETDIGESDPCATFHIHLDRGHTQIRTRFTRPGDEAERGAYYARIRKRE